MVISFYNKKLQNYLDTNGNRNSKLEKNKEDLIWHARGKRSAWKGNQQTLFRIINKKGGAPKSYNFGTSSLFFSFGSGYFTRISIVIQLNTP